MGIRKIIKKGDISLKKISRPVTEFNARLKILLDDMRDTLAEANGVGLAAPRWACCAVRCWLRTSAGKSR